jgi:CubicO group peptidase (beta-lactamase class C family)
MVWPGFARGQVPDASAFTGRWGGTIGPAGRGLRIVLEIDGASSPVLVSVDQGGARIPSTGGTVSASSLELAFGSVRGRLVVRRADDGTLVGTWSQGREMAITLTPLMAGEAVAAAPAVVRGAMAEEVTKALAASGLPALGAAWARGQSGAVSVAGIRAQRASAPVTDTDRWHVGSITKSMTGTMLARLVKQGKLSWDTTVETVFGQTIPSIHADLKTVTLHELVTGKSGIASSLPIMEFLGFPRHETDARASRQAWASKALQRAPQVAPRTTFLYPNSGFVIAGAMAEAVTGQSWEALMQAEVFAPLGLSSAGFGPPDSAANPSGHRRSLMGGLVALRSGEDGADNPVAMGPAGIVHMTLADLARFGRHHAEGAAGRGDRGYLDHAAWQFLHTPPDGGDYAVGLVRRADGRLWHNGSNTMWYGELLIDPMTGAAACAVANAATNEGAVSDVVDAAIQEAARLAG